VVADARAYRDKVIAEAEGDASRFTAVLKEYEKAPEVTRERLYLDAVQEVLANSTKVIVDVESGNNLMLLPLDKLVGEGAGAGPLSRLEGSEPSQQEASQQPMRDVNRGRRMR
jgi:membrane protease subunit HflK